MGDESDTLAIARRALDDIPDDGGIDPELAQRLIAAYWDYPSLTTACQSCNVTLRSLRSMLARGAESGAPESLRRFARDLAMADADKAKMWADLAHVYLRQGDTKSAKLIMERVDSRWGDPEGESIMAMLTSGKRTTSLKARLLRPSSLLVAMFQAILDEPNEAWSKLLRETGWVRALGQPAPEEPADETELDELQEHEGDEEPPPGA